MSWRHTQNYGVRLLPSLQVGPVKERPADKLFAKWVVEAGGRIKGATDEEEEAEGGTAGGGGADDEEVTARDRAALVEGGDADDEREVRLCVPFEVCSHIVAIHHLYFF